ncbi:LpxL/LpxP family acyltransferase [Cephaloticoccus primus]|uniref:LpxL/LpxP family acyltransferase n=1 Tax=Cephaloticoccus primus TaxID=1548207 RepID=UPI0009EDCD5F|nr:glycosyl transferase [Cephaloticoccus primus]
MTTKLEKSVHSTHWAQQNERGSLFLMRLGFGAARLLGRRILTPVIWLVVLYFYVSNRNARQAIAYYQERLRQSSQLKAHLPRTAPVYRQYLAFAQALLDKLDVWNGKITRADLELIDPHGLHKQMGKGRGQILITSHLGNVEITRALAGQVTGIRLNVLVHSKNAQRFSRLLAETRANIHLIEVTQLTPAIMLDLAQRLDQGEWLAISGDRTPVSGERVTEVSFLGGPARFPQGPWLLAALLRCEVNLLVCLRNPKRAAKRFTVIIERLTDSQLIPRQQRASTTSENIQLYSSRLASYCGQAPLQWFNFYPFWDKNSTSD